MKYRLILFFLLAVLGQTLAQRSQLSKTVVFSYDENSDNPFGYRIPSLVTTKNGALLAIVERRIGLHDHAQNDIVLRRSENNGLTWSEIQVIHEDGKNSLNDP